MEKRKFVYLAPEAMIFSFIPKERLGAVSEPDDPWFTGAPESGGTTITSDRIEIDPVPTFGPED